MDPLTQMLSRLQNPQQFQMLLQELTARGVPVNPQDTSGFNHRNIAGTNVLSRHATGEAIDVNASTNPLGVRQGSGPGAIDPAIAREVAQLTGTQWGGDWTRPDPMHFQLRRRNEPPPVGTLGKNMTGEATSPGSAPLGTIDAGLGGNSPMMDPWMSGMLMVQAAQNPAQFAQVLDQLGQPPPAPGQLPQPFGLGAGGMNAPSGDIDWMSILNSGNIAGSGTGDSVFSPRPPGIHTTQDPRATGIVEFGGTRPAPTTPLVTPPGAAIPPTGQLDPFAALAAGPGMMGGEDASGGMVNPIAEALGLTGVGAEAAAGPPGAVGPGAMTAQAPGARPPQQPVIRAPTAPMPIMSGGVAGGVKTPTMEVRPGPTPAQLLLAAMLGGGGQGGGAQNPLRIPPVQMLTR